MPIRPTTTGAAVAALVLAVALLAGCGSSREDEAPAPCLATSQGYLRALEAAPGQVRLAGSTPISACLVPEQSGGQLSSIGREMIVAATKLNAEARRDPGGPAAVQLGYLIGAGSQGGDAIHTHLGRRPH